MVFRSLPIDKNLLKSHMHVNGILFKFIDRFVKLDQNRHPQHARQISQ